MRVWVVEKTGWNGEHDVNSVHKVFASAAAAQRFCDEENAKATSSYSAKFDFDEEGLEVED